MNIGVFLICACGKHLAIRRPAQVACVGRKLGKEATLANRSDSLFLDRFRSTSCLHAMRSNVGWIAEVWSFGPQLRQRPRGCACITFLREFTRGVIQEGPRLTILREREPVA